MASMRFGALLPVAFVAVVACEAVPPLTYRAADTGGTVDDNGGSVAVILDPPSDLGGDGAAPADAAPTTDAASDGATRTPYEKVCADQRPATAPFCCGDNVLCAGKAKKCEGACVQCTTQCAGHVCCILLPNGNIKKCSDDTQECAAAYGN
jgi:hypothetical protein